MRGPDWLELIGVVLLVVAVGFFSAAETTITRTGRARAYRLAEEGQRLRTVLTRGGNLVPAQSGELERTRLRRVALQVARPLEVRQVRVHRRRRRQAHLLADLPHRRRVAVPVDVVDQEVLDLLLPSGQHRASSWMVERVFAIRVETPADDVKP